MTEFFPILIFAIVLVGFVVTNMVLTHVIGPRKQTTVKGMPYESGMDPIGDARQPFDIKFYLVAILFLLFDVELLFMYPWTYAAYADTNGVPDPLRLLVFQVMISFTGTLAIAYVYAWRKGVFQWR